MKKIIVDDSFFQTRIALVKDGEPIEFFYQSRQEKSLVGNIYAGRVENCIKGMQACFVNIGLDKNGYLPLSKDRKIKNGQTVIVQVEKDAFGTKGVVLTEKISFAGKFAVIIKNDGKSIGISKKITDKNERDRIFSIVSAIVPENCSVIVRTEGENKSAEDFESEISYLAEKSEFVFNKAIYHKAPSLIFEEEDFVVKTLKNIFTSDVDEVVLNSEKVFNSVSAISSFKNGKIELYSGKVPIFSEYFIESKIDKLFSNKIWLKSGGFIVIEQTEACVVIDVNTGKYTGKKDTEETFLKTNIEAAEEIAKQLRLRNLSGMIIIDFIDMKSEENRLLLTKKLQEAVSNDRLKTTVVGLTELGLMQLTRKKSSLPVLDLISRECMYCKGNGKIPSFEYTSGKILREIETVFSQTMFSAVTVKSNKKVLDFIKYRSMDYVREIEERFSKSILFEEIETGSFDYYEIEKTMHNNNGV